MEPTGVAPGTDPAINQGDPNKSTLDNLDTNIATELNKSAGGPPPTPAPTEVKPDPEAAAKMTRLSQDNSQLRATLLKMGIDPDSQTAEQLRSGLVTFDEIIRTRQPAPPPPVQPTLASPKVPLGQKLADLKHALTGQDGKNVTAEEYRATQNQLLEVVQDLVEANQSIARVQENNDLKTLVDQTLSATKQVFGATVAAKVPQDVREIGEKLFVGATDIGVGELAAQVGRERAFTPQAYRHVAGKLAPDFDRFVQSIFTAGQQAALTSIQRGQPVSQGINPLPPGTGRGSPPAPPNKKQFSLENLDRNVDAFIANTQAQI